MQEIITHIIVLSAAVCTLVYFFKMFIPVKRKGGENICNSCKGCSAVNVEKPASQNRY